MYFIYTAEIVSTILGNTVTFEVLPVHQLDYSREVKKEVITLNVKDAQKCHGCFAKRNKTKCNSLWMLDSFDSVCLSSYLLLSLNISFLLTICSYH